MTFLRQNYLEQVPGVETYYSLLSADPYRLPQPTTAFCTGFLGGKYHGGEALVNHCRNTYGESPLPDGNFKGIQQGQGFGQRKGCPSDIVFERIDIVVVGNLLIFQVQMAKQFILEFI
jgi:hypothetical protein